MNFSDNRKFPRVEFRQPVQYRFPEIPTLSGCVGYDLSCSGVRFRTEEFLAVDAQVVVNLVLNSEREALLDARVVWAQKVPHSESYYVGCEFLDNRDNVFPRFIVKNFLDKS